MSTISAAILPAPKRRSPGLRDVAGVVATGAVVVSYYWHFVDVVWIGLFATIYIIR